MSNIPEARRNLEEALDYISPEGFAATLIERALAQMTREKPKHKAPRKHGPPTEAQKAEVRRLHALKTLSQQEIANLVGLGSGGRVSEIVNK